MISLVTLVCIAGIVLGLIHRQRAEKPILIMMVSLGTLVMIGVLDGAVEFVLYRGLGSARSGGAIISDLSRVWGWFGGLIRAAAIGGLIFAVLYERGFEVLDFSSLQKKSEKIPKPATEPESAAHQS